MWTNGGEGVKEAIGTGKSFSSKYQSNNCPDKSADGMFTYAKSKGMDWGSIDTIPEIPGLAVRLSGHVGVYIGDGYVIEERGFNYGCQKTKLKDRNFTHWYKLPFIKYDNVKVPELGDRILKKGMTGLDVKELQKLLLKLNMNLPTYGADGEFGNETVKAVKRFQEIYNLPITGIVDKKTLDTMLNPPSFKLGDRILKEGDIGPDVEEAQKLLAKLGFNNKYGADGEFGSATKKSVIEFQIAYGIKPTGTINKETVEMLLNPKKDEEKPEEPIKGGAIGVAISVGSMHLREKNDPDAASLGIINKGEMINVYEITNNNWLRTRIKDKEGYTSNSNEEYYNYIPLIPDIISSINVDKVDHELKGEYATTGNINVRNGPGTKYPSLVIFPKNTSVECTGGYTISNDKTKWLFIYFTYKNKDYAAYASTKYLKKVK